MDNHTELVDTIKLLIYKAQPNLLEKVNFEDNETFLEPLLFSYFQDNDNLFPKEVLEEILQGYYVNQESLKIKNLLNKDEIAYVPKRGYYKKKDSIPFQKIQYISNTSIELIQYPVVPLKNIFRDFQDNLIDETKIEISKKLCDKHIKSLTNAISFIKDYSSAHYNLIEQCCKKIILFKTSPKNTNSFATINAHGIAFFNVFQEDYDEVFFVDDIAHQTGHIIATTILFERKKYFLIDETISIGGITNNPKEYRSFYVLVHALYTYYTTLICLDNCLENNCFDQRQVHEAKGRIGFYLSKYTSDQEKFIEIIDFYQSIESVFTKKGVKFYELMFNKCSEILKKWHPVVCGFNYKNQPYNFTYKEFIELNKLKND